MWLIRVLCILVFSSSVSFSIERNLARDQFDKLKDQGEELTYYYYRDRQENELKVEGYVDSSVLLTFNNTKLTAPGLQVSPDSVYSEYFASLSPIVWQLNRPLSMSELIRMQREGEEKGTGLIGVPFVERFRQGSKDIYNIYGLTRMVVLFFKEGVSENARKELQENVKCGPFVGSLRNSRQFTIELEEGCAYNTVEVAKILYESGLIENAIPNFIRALDVRRARSR